MTFAVGDRVRVADRAHAGHHRTPGYVKGRRGRIERVHGSFTNPETRAYGSDGLPEVVLYQVAFELEQARTYVDVYEHWLEEVR
jgi:nitrile hydratase